MRKGMLVLIVTLLLGGCDSNSPGNTPTDPGDLTPRFTTKEQQTLQPFASCDAFKDYATEALTLEYTTAYWAGVPCWSCEIFVDAIGAPVRATLETPPPGTELDATASPEPQPATDSGGGTRVNDTNTQEAGVDEADRVESSSDGRVMYFLDSAFYGGTQQVLVFDTSTPAAPRIIARIDLGNQRYASGLYLDEPNATLLVLNQGGYFFPLAADAAFAPEPDSGSSFGSVVQAFDVSDPSAPTSIGRFATDAQIISSRRIGDRLHVVSQFGIPLPIALRDDEGFFSLVYDDYYRAVVDDDEGRVASLRARIAARIAEAMARTDVSELLPRNTNAEGVLETLACTRVYAPDIEQRLGLIQVSSMATDTSNPESIGLLNNGWNVYGSSSSLYISQTSGGWWFDPAQVQQTAIHRFALSEDGAPAYKGSGVVDGWASNSYQFSEFAGHLRVATGLSGAVLLPAEPTPDIRPVMTNQVSVLRLEDDGLELVGTTPTFGDDETIRSSRFLGERGFVVTFRQIDPLFALDLSDPTNPQIRGELEIPGFSSYIYPLSPDRLLTIGRAGGEDGFGVANTFQLQIFDVAAAFDNDPDTRLTQLAVEPIALNRDEYAFSTAEYEPLAFNFLASATDPQQGTLSIPVQIGSSEPQRAFSGFLTYDIDGSNGSILPLLEIDHAIVDPGSGSNCPDGKTPPPTSADGGGPSCASFAPVIWNEPLRTKIVETGTPPQRFFFTFSSRYLKVDTPDGGAAGNEPESLATISFTP